MHLPYVPWLILEKKFPKIIISVFWIPKVKIQVIIPTNSEPLKFCYKFVKVGIWLKTYFYEYLPLYLTYRDALYLILKVKSWKTTLFDRLKQSEQKKKSLNNFFSLHPVINQWYIVWLFCWKKDDANHFFIEILFSTIIKMRIKLERLIFIPERSEGIKEPWKSDLPLK